MIYMEYFKLSADTGDWEIISLENVLIPQEIN